MKEDTEDTADAEDTEDAATCIFLVSGRVRFSVGQPLLDERWSTQPQVESTAASELFPRQQQQAPAQEPESIGNCTTLFTG